MKDKIKEFFNTKTVIACTILTLIYLMSGYCKWIEIGVTLVAIIFFSVLSIQESFCIFLYLHSYTLSNICYDSCFLVTLIFYCIIMLVKYVQGAKCGKYPIYKNLIISISVLMGISIIISFLHRLYFGAFLYLTYFPLFYLLFAMRKEFDIIQGMNYMAGGLFISCGLSVISLILPAYQYRPFYCVDRFCGFINHPNYLYMRALFVLTYYMYRYLDNNLSNGMFISIFIMSCIIVLATLSKTGICLLALFTILFVILYLKQDFKGRIKIVGIFTLLLLAIALVCFKFIVQIFSRFINGSLYGAGSIINSLLTGRGDIWLDYLNATVDSSFNLLFGHGILSEEVFIWAQGMPRASHNLYLFVLYRFGIIGTIMIGYIACIFLKILNKGKPKLIAWLPMIWLIIESMCDNTFKCYNFTYIALAVMIMFSQVKEKTCEQNGEIKQLKK